MVTRIGPPGFQGRQALVDPVRASELLQLLQLGCLRVERRRGAGDAGLAREYAVEGRSGALNLSLRRPAR